MLVGDFITCLQFIPTSMDPPYKSMKYLRIFSQLWYTVSPYTDPQCTIFPYYSVHLEVKTKKDVKTTFMQGIWPKDGRLVHIATQGQWVKESATTN